MGFTRESQPEHVYAHRDRHRDVLSLQRRGHHRAGTFPSDSFRSHGGEVGNYFEAAAVITVLVLLGQVRGSAPAAGPAMRSRRS